MQLKIDCRFKKRVQGMISKYEFQVGILDDGPHKEAKVGKRGLKGQDVISSYAGGPVRKKSTKDSVLTLSEISEANRERYGNYLTEPFKKKSSEIIKFSNEFLKLAFGHGMKKRVENLLQAIVRNPILRGEYGSNSALTQKIKGFDRSMIDTGQFFKAIKSKVRIKANV